MAGFLETISFRLLPGRCLPCGARSGRNLDLCQACEHELPFNQPCCRRCGMPLAADAVACGRCLQKPPLADAIRTPFLYAFPLGTLIQRFKFHSDHPAGRLLGDLFAQHLEVPEALPDCLLPVPLHVTRFRQRGFNQSTLLAQALAARIGIAVRADLLVRQRETAAQTGMDARARRRNVRGAFALARATLPARIAIVDDVVTTGSTTDEMTQILRKAGVRWIEVWALARTA